MNLKNYNTDRDEFLSKIGDYTKDEILDLNGHPLSEILLKLFKFGKDNIARYSPSFGLNKTYFLFLNDDTPNAEAYGDGTCNAIFITNGLINELYARMHQKNLDFNSILDGKFKNLHESLPDSLGLIMFEIGIIFTFFHEFAHIIQFKHSTSFLAKEHSKGASFDQLDHLMEYDSDLQGCNFILNYIANYCDDNIIYFSSEDDKINFHWMALSTLIITMLLFLNDFENEGADRNLYIKEFSHPHPAIRIHYLLQHYSFNMNKTFRLNVTLADALKECLKFCNEYFSGTDIISNYFELIWHNSEVMNKYLDELFDLLEAETTMSRHYIHKLI